MKTKTIEDWNTLSIREDIKFFKAIGEKDFFITKGKSIQIMKKLRDDADRYMRLAKHAEKEAEKSGDKELKRVVKLCGISFLSQKEMTGAYLCALTGNNRYVHLISQTGRGMIDTAKMQMKLAELKNQLKI
jgi:hypothetical protein